MVFTYQWQLLQEAGLNRLPAKKIPFFVRQEIEQCENVALRKHIDDLFDDAFGTAANVKEIVH